MVRRSPHRDDQTTATGRPRKRRELLPLPDNNAELLFESLRDWRRKEAARQRVPPYVIFHDQTLADIARSRPTSRATLASIGGVGQGKLDRYGDVVLEIIHAST